MKLLIALLLLPFLAVEANGQRTPPSALVDSIRSGISDAYWQSISNDPQLDRALAEVIEHTASPIERRNALMYMARLDTPLATDYVESRLARVADSDSEIRSVLHGLGWRRDEEGRSRLASVLERGDRHAKLAALHALYGDPAAEPLWRRAASDPDRIVAEAAERLLRGEAYVPRGEIMRLDASELAPRLDDHCGDVSKRDVDMKDLRHLFTSDHPFERRLRSALGIERQPDSVDVVAMHDPADCLRVLQVFEQHFDSILAEPARWHDGGWDHLVMSAGAYDLLLLVPGEWGGLEGWGPSLSVILREGAYVGLLIM